MTAIQTPTQTSGSLGASSISGSYSGRNPGAMSSNLTVSAGDKVVGTVESVKDGTVTIRLSNDATMTARLDEGMNLTEGKTVTFEVAQSGASVVLRPLLTNTSTANVVMQALQQAGLSSTGQNVSMVETMISQGMGIDRNSLLHMSGQMMTYPEAGIDTLASLTKLGIPVQESTIQGYENYANLNHYLSGGVSNLTQGIADTALELMNREGPEAAHEFVDGVMKELLFTLPTEKGDSLMNPVSDIGMVFAAENRTDNSVSSGEPSLPNPVLLTMEAEGEIPAGTAMNAAQMDSGSIPLTEQPNSPNPTGDENRMPEPMGNENTALQASEGLASQNTLSQNLQTTVNQNPQASENENPQPVEGQNLKTPVGEPQSPVREPQSPVREPQSPTVGSDSQPLQEFSGRNEAVSQIAGESLSIHEKLDRLQHALLNKWSLDPAKLAGEDGEAFRNQLKATLSSIEETAERIREQILGSAAKDTEAGRNLSQTAENLRENIDFLNQINELYSYVQIPLRNAGKMANSELYVFSRKSKQFKPGEELTAFLHLDMEHLGPTDVYVRLKDEKLSTKFTLADESCLDLIETNMHYLTKRLEDKGYSIHTECTVKEKEEPFEAIKAMKNEGGGSVTVPLLHYSLDVRA